MNRNARLARSIIFGGLAKLSGAGVVFLGLPLAAHLLTPAEYGGFLELMALMSLAMLVFSITLISGTRQIAWAASTSSQINLNGAISRSQREFFLGSLISLLIVFAALYAPVIRSNPWMAYILLLAPIHGLVMWADAYRLGTRSDFVSSLFQLVANLAVVCLLLFFLPRQIYYVSAIYFLIPIFFSTLILIHLLSTANVFIRPQFGVATKDEEGKFTDYKSLSVIAVADYLRIYGPGLLLAWSGDARSQVFYGTLILFVARLVNPITLITRPLLPAYIDAKQNRDARWVAQVRKFFSVTALGTVCMVFFATFVVPVDEVNSLTERFDFVLTRIDIAFVLIYFSATAYSALVAPILLSTSRTSSVFATISFAAAALKVAGIGVLIALGWTEHSLILIAVVSLLAVSATSIAGLKAMQVSDIPID